MSDDGCSALSAVLRLAGLSGSRDGLVLWLCVAQPCTFQLPSSCASAVSGLASDLIPARAMTLSAVSACIGVGASIVEGSIRAISNLVSEKEKRDRDSLGKLLRRGPGKVPRSKASQGFTSKAQVCLHSNLLWSLLQTELLLGIEWCTHDHRHLTGRIRPLLPGPSLPTWTGEATTSRESSFFCSAATPLPPNLPAQLVP